MFDSPDNDITPEHVDTPIGMRGEQAGNETDSLSVSSRKTTIEAYGYARCLSSLAGNTSLGLRSPTGNTKAYVEKVPGVVPTIRRRHGRFCSREEQRENSAYGRMRVPTDGRSLRFAFARAVDLATLLLLLLRLPRFIVTSIERSRGKFTRRRVRAEAKCVLRYQAGRIIHHSRE